MRAKEGDPNKYGGKCVACGKFIPSGVGKLVKGMDSKWFVSHRGACATPSQQTDALAKMGYTYTADAIRTGMDRVGFVPDSTSGYRVMLDGTYIGRVEFRSADSSFNKRIWRWFAPNGGIGSAESRYKGAEALLELHRQAA